MNSLKKNFTANMISKSVQILANFVTFPYITRILGPEGMGDITFAESFVSWFILLAAFGTHAYGIRIVPNSKKLSKTVHELFVITLFMGFFSYILLLLINHSPLMMIFGTEILFAFANDYLLEGLEQQGYIAKRTITVYLIRIILIFLIHPNVIEYAFILVGTVIFSVICDVWYLRRFVSYRVQLPLDFMQHVKPLFIFLLISFIVSAYTTMDKVMLGFLSDNTQVGYYSVAVKCKQGFTAVIFALTGAFAPRANFYIKNDLPAYKKLIQKAFRFDLLLLPLCIAVIIFAKWIVLILSGPDYLPAVSSLRTIMPGAMCISVTNVITTLILIPHEKERYVLLGNMTGMIINVIANFILIPKMGATGAALGTTCAEIGVLWVVAVCMVVTTMSNDMKTL